MTLVLRMAEPDDALAVAAVHVRAWQAAYRGLLPATYLARLRADERAARYDFTPSGGSLAPRTIVATDGAGILGFATVRGAHDVNIPWCGELCGLYVDPRRWGEGVGRALLAAARAHLADNGFNTAVLWVLTGNWRAQRFYGRDAWMPDGASRTVRAWGVTIDEVRYVRRLRSLRAWR